MFHSARALLFSFGVKRKKPFCDDRIFKGKLCIESLSLLPHLRKNPSLHFLIFPELGAYIDVSSQ